MRAQTDGTRTEIDPLVISADDSTALAADIPLADGAVTSLRPLSGIRATDMFLPVCDLSAPGFDGLSQGTAVSTVATGGSIRVSMHNCR